MLEVELKYKLQSKMDYLKLRNYLKSPMDSKSQLNIYFDSKYLQIFGLSLRLRIEKRSDSVLFILTSKSRSQKKENLFIVKELEKEINEKMALSIIENKIPLRDIFMVLGHKDLHGQFENYSFGSYSLNDRMDYSFSGLILALDHTTYYNNTLDFELEYEHDDVHDKIREADIKIRKLFNNLCINWKKQEMTKRQRAYLNSRGIDDIHHIIIKTFKEYLDCRIS